MSVEENYDKSVESESGMFEMRQGGTTSNIAIENSREIRVGDEIKYQSPVVYNVDVLNVHKCDRGEK
jgi:hypothetical protein